MRLLRRALRDDLPRRLEDHGDAIRDLERRDQQEPPGLAAGLAQLARLQADVNELLINPPRAEVYRSTAQAIAANTPTLLSFDTEVYNPHELWAVGDATKIVINTPGAYMVWAQIEWELPTLVDLYLRLRVKRTQADATASFILSSVSSAQVAIDHGQNVARTAKLLAGDFLQVEVTQTSFVTSDVQATADLSPYFGVRRVGH